MSKIQKRFIVGFAFCCLLALVVAVLLRDPNSNKAPLPVAVYTVTNKDMGWWPVLEEKAGAEIDPITNDRFLVASADLLGGRPTLITVNYTRTYVPMIRSAGNRKFVFVQCSSLGDQGDPVYRAKLVRSVDLYKAKVPEDLWKK